MDYTEKWVKLDICNLYNINFNPIYYETNLSSTGIRSL